MLPFLQAEENNVTHAIIGFAPNELAYGFKVNDILDLLANLPSKNYSQLRQLKREKAKFVMTFAAAFNKSRYDAVHQALDVKIKNKVYLRLHQGYIIPGLFNHKLFHQRVGPFTVLEKIGNLAFRLELPSVMRIHSVVSIAQLKPTTKKSNSYERVINAEPPSIKKKKNDPTPHYEIERLLNKRVSRNQTQYLVK